MRRILFLIIIPIFYILGLPLLAVTYLIGTFNRPLRYRIAFYYNKLTGWLFLTIAGAKCVTEGIKYLDFRQPTVLISNHRSMLDIPVILLYSKHPINFIGKKSLLKWPFIGWWMHAMGGLFLDRKNPRQGLKTILEAIDRIKEGESFVIFPEGTRSKGQELLDFKQGSLKLASKTGSPILPLSILGTADVFENNGFNLRPDTIYLSVHEPIFLEQLSEEDKKHSAKYVHNIINDMFQNQLTKRSSSLSRS